MAQFLPCQKTLLGITAGLVVLAIISPFVIPKIFELTRSFAVAMPNDSQREIVPVVESHDSSCNFSLENTIVLNEQQFMYCQWAPRANAIMARKVCQRFNSRFVDGRVYDTDFFRRKFFWSKKNG